MNKDSLSPRAAREAATQGPRLLGGPSQVRIQGSIYRYSYTAIHHLDNR